MSINLPNPVSARVAIIEDHHMVREAIALMLNLEPDFTLVGNMGSAHDGELFLAREPVDLLVLDLLLGEDKGDQFVPRYLALQPALRILLMTGSDAPQLLYQAAHSGAHGLIPKNASADELCLALRTIHAGQRYLSPGLAQWLSAPQQDDSLTSREQDIVKLIATGNGYADIALQLGISPATVRKHRENLMRKLGLHNTAEVTAYAIRQGLVR